MHLIIPKFKGFSRMKRDPENSSNSEDSCLASMGQESDKLKTTKESSRVLTSAPC